MDGSVRHINDTVVDVPMQVDISRSNVARSSENAIRVCSRLESRPSSSRSSSSTSKEYAGSSPQAPEIAVHHDAPLNRILANGESLPLASLLRHGESFDEESWKAQVESVRRENYDGPHPESSVDRQSGATLFGTRGRAGLGPVRMNRMKVSGIRRHDSRKEDQCPRSSDGTF
jgi:hypothetical protein